MSYEFHLANPDDKRANDEADAERYDQFVVEPLDGCARCDSARGTPAPRCTSLFRRTKLTFLLLSSTRRAQSRQTATASRQISSLTHAKEIKCERILAIRSAVVLAMQQYDFLVCSELLTGFHRTRERTGIAIADSLCWQLWKTPWPDTPNLFQLRGEAAPAPPSEIIDRRGRKMSRERNRPLVVSAIRPRTRVGCIDFAELSQILRRALREESD